MCALFHDNDNGNRNLITNSYFHDQYGGDDDDNRSLQSIDKLIKDYSINLTESFYQIIPDENKRNHIKKFHLTVDWIRHAESCSNATPLLHTASYIKAKTLYNPPLTYLGMQQAIRLGMKYTKEKEYHIIFASPSFRSIMTALLSLRGRDDVTIYVVPYISELPNIAGSIDYDIQNFPVDIEILKRGVFFIKDWLRKNWIEHFNDYELVHMLLEIKSKINTNYKLAMSFNILIDQILNWNYKLNTQDESIVEHLYSLDFYIEKLKTMGDFSDHDILKYRRTLQNLLLTSYLRGPTVDFSIYQHFSELAKNGQKEYNLKKPTFDKFYTHVVSYVIDKFFSHYIDRRLKIACYSHGALMRGELNRSCNLSLKHMGNTEVWEEECMRWNQLFETSCHRRYDPTVLDQLDKDTFNILKQSNVINVCDSKSLKGILNYPIWKDKPKVAKTLGIYDMTLFQSKDEKDNTTKDSTFYYQNSNKYHPERGHPNSFSGGKDKYYHQKYIKYKTKYLHLKDI